MKRLFMLFAAMVLLAGQMFAAPVDVNTAKILGAKYLKTNVLSAKDITNVEHVYTLRSEDNTPYLYVFNYENGFVVVAADDRAYPILGYTEGGVFDENNIPEGLRYFLGHYGREIQYAIDNDLVAEQEVAEQWDLLSKEGVIMHTRMEKAVQPLLATSWDQGWPYNYYAPACSSYWTNNHCYAGCVATAMSQVMKFWNWPETGVGEHSYNTSPYPGNGVALSANFGATTYNWSVMPNQLGSQANEAALAVALLMYHCGIAVDMAYAPDGSGAHTEDVAQALIDYFRYGASAYMDSRDYYTKTKWEDMLIAQLDKGIPFVYSGSDTDGGHAFNCDGYNNQRYFHFNYGWSGSYNNYYQIDALNTGNGHFNTYQRAVFGIIPDYIYNAMVPAIETLEATVADAMTKRVEVSWMVPSESVSGNALESIQSIVLLRNGETIQTFDNPAPGEFVTITDNVPEYGAYEYTIYGVNDNIEGELFSQAVIVGPKCTWKFVCQTTNFQGWVDGKLLVVDDNGTVFKELQMSSSSPLSEKVSIPEGDFTLQWVAPSTVISSLTITLKNSANQQVYSFTGSSSQLSGTIYSGNNDCPECTPPTNLVGVYAYQGGADGTLLTWDCDYTPSNYKIYRSSDGETYEEIAKIGNNVSEYFDAVNVTGMYFYKVTAYSTACESTPAVTPDYADYVVVEVLSVIENTIDARLYPNPANTAINIEAVGMEEVTVCNTMGQVVYRYNGSADALNINTAGLEAGIYMVNVRNHEGNAKVRIVITH